MRRALPKVVFAAIKPAAIAGCLLLSACSGGSASSRGATSTPTPTPTPTPTQTPRTNSAPTANAGPDLSSTSGATVQLQGTGLDSDGTVTGFAWRQTAGPSVTLASAQSASTTFVAPTVTQVTTLTFALTVTDNGGATGTDSVDVMVSPAAAAQSQTTTSFSWTPVANVVEYRVRRNGTQIALLEETQERFHDMDLTPGTSYSYAVEALNAQGTVLSTQTISMRTDAGAAELVPALDSPPGNAVRGRSFTTFGWTPNPLYDTCSKELHDSFWTFGPDNRVYPTWHPPVYEFANGTRCTFGHEHGQDQRTSNLFRTVGAIPFGYVNEQLSPNDPAFQRNEDHFGHKVALFNNILDIIPNPNGPGEIQGTMRCDILFKLHQGTHSADALRNNTHERVLNYRCPNGLEVRYKALQPFGEANSFRLEAPNNPLSRNIITAGAVPPPCGANNAALNCQPSGSDRRIIPALEVMRALIAANGGATDGNALCDTCSGTAAARAELATVGFPANGVANNGPWYISLWNNEAWQGGPIHLFFGANNGARIFQLAGGPYWNLQSSSRYYDPNGVSDPTSPDYLIARQIALCYQPGSPPFDSFDCRLARRRSATPLDYRDPRSPIKGTVRFNETNFIQVFNPSPARERVYFDPYGRTTMDPSDGVNPRDELPLRRSTRYPIQGYFRSNPNEINVKLSNWAGSNQCGGGSCYTDFNFYRLRDGTLIDAGVHAPN